MSYHMPDKTIRNIVSSRWVVTELKCMKIEIGICY